MSFKIIEDKCLGCGACRFACLFVVPKAVDEAKNKYVIDAEACTGCGQCENICPNSAIVPAEGHRKIKRVSIDASKCLGCSLCSRVCVSKAAHGEIKKPFEIDESRCIKCGMCATKCKKDAIVIEYE